MLTDAKIRAAKPGEKPIKLFDEKGLYLLIAPAGGTWWRFKYRYAGKEKLLSMGTYPEVTLKEARDHRDEARRLLRYGTDPSAKRRQDRNVAGAKSATFHDVAEEYLEAFKAKWTPVQRERIAIRLDTWVHPWIGDKAVAEITSADVLAVLQRVHSDVSLQSAHRARQHCSQVFRYAVSTGRAAIDPTASLRGALPTHQGKHMPALRDPREIGAMLRAIDGYHGTHVVKVALQLAPYVFVRPGELRRAEWQEIDLVNGEWRIPAERMKMKEQHIVPLSSQALWLLRDLLPLTGRGRYVFPTPRDNGRPLSNNALTAALHRMGMKGEQSAHGFRSIASTMLNELGWPADAIERQLAHQERDDVRAAYNYAQYLPERRKMMQAWADYLDKLKAET